MLTEYLDAPGVVARLRGGPAGAHVDEFTNWLAGKGYGRGTVRGLVRGLERFAVWARTNGLEAGEADRQVLRRFLEHLKASGRFRHRCGSQTEDVTAARRFVRFLSERGLLVVPPSRSATEPALLVEFRQWLVVHRGVRESTLAAYGRIVEDLLRVLGEDAGAYQAGDLRRFVLDRTRQHGISKAKQVVTSVRMFLRFLIATQRCRPGLDATIPVIAQWRLSSLPRHLATSEVERLIACCDERTATALRDKAIILLAARLGLRAGDISGLTFDAIDWKRGRLRVSGKTRREVWLPIPQECGDAILAYLEGERQRIAGPQVFVKASAPHGPIASYLVSSVVRRAMARAGIEAVSRGAHVLRHSAATAMLRAGATLHEIGSVLRHASIETTYHYAKVDQELLRMVAAPWPVLPETPMPDFCTRVAEVQAIAQPWPEVPTC